MASEEEADIDRIVDERKKGSRKEYLCTWLDSAPPQWVSAKHLKETLALKEWLEADEEVPEVHDPKKVWQEKTKRLAEWPCFLLGAGISAPCLPTFRGAGGLWTKRPKVMSKATQNPEPTAAHKALVNIEAKGKMLLKTMTT